MTDDLLDPNTLHLSYNGVAACDGTPLAKGRVKLPKNGAPVCYSCALIAEGLKSPHPLAVAAERKPYKHDSN